MQEASAFNFDEKLDPEIGYHMPSIIRMLDDRKRWIQYKIDNGLMSGEWGQVEKALCNPHSFLLYAVMDHLSADRVPVESSPAFINVRWDMEAICETAADLYNRGRITEVWVDGIEGDQIRDVPLPSEKVGHFPGYKAIQKRLHILGIPKEFIKPTDAAYNTPDEHLQYCILAKKYKWKSAITLCNSYQSLRVHRGLLRVMRDQGYWVQNHFVIPGVSSWDEDVKGAQGDEAGARFNQHFAEYHRNLEYGCKIPPDLLSLVEAGNYYVFGRRSIIDGKLTKPLSSE